MPGLLSFGKGREKYAANGPVNSNQSLDSFLTLSKNMDDPRPIED